MIAPLGDLLVLKVPTKLLYCYGLRHRFIKKFYDCCICMHVPRERTLQLYAQYSDTFRISSRVIYFFPDNVVTCFVPC